MNNPEMGCFNPNESQKFNEGRIKYLEKKQKLTPEEKTELEIRREKFNLRKDEPDKYQGFYEGRIKYLEKKQKLTPDEVAELNVRRETGDRRIVYLESKRAGEKGLTSEEKTELEIRREKFGLKE